MHKEFNAKVIIINGDASGIGKVTILNLQQKEQNFP